ncbi:hypothetical protein NTH58_001552 [Enterobacter oligotrophicus]|nr:hypothetical protein [Enterobacter oligotrophicus]
MSLLLAHQLSPTARRALVQERNNRELERRNRKCKAGLAIVRIQKILGLSDSELIEIVGDLLRSEPGQSAKG